MGYNLLTDNLILCSEHMNPVPLHYSTWVEPGNSSAEGGPQGELFALHVELLTH